MVLVVGEHWNQGTCSIADHELYVPSASSVPSADCCDSCSVSVTSPVLIGAGSSTASFAPFDFDGLQPIAHLWDEDFARSAEGELGAGHPDSE